MCPRRGRVVGVLTTLGLLADMVVPSPASAEVLNIPLSKTPTPSYGTEHLPSPSQFSARVWATASYGNTAYVGGEFTKFGARGTSKAQARNHIARVSATSGTVDPSWDPDTGNNNAANPVRSIGVSPDGSTVYFSGSFTSIAGQPRPGVGAFVSDAAGNRASPCVPATSAVQALASAPD